MAVSFCGKRILLTRSNLISNQIRNGYIVLVPEIGEDLPDKNPLLRDDGLPEFNALTIEKCVGAVAKQTMEYETGVRSIEERLSDLAELPESYDVFNEILNPLEQLGSPLDITWGLSKTLYLGNQSLMPTKTYLTIHDRARRAKTAQFNSYPIYKTISQAYAKSSSKLTEEQNRVIHKYLLEGRLNGLSLDSSTKAKLDDTLNTLGAERAKFKNKVDVATKQFSHTITTSDIMIEFPEDLLKQIAADPTQPTKGPWKVTLQPHIAAGFLEYCPKRDLRWNVWQADTRKASGYTEKALENSTHLEKIRSLRQDQANLLGYETYVDMSMETKMAGNVGNVRNMLASLLEHARPMQESEVTSLEAFAARGGFEGNLELYDVPYWKRLQRKALFNYDKESLRDYFPLPKVLNGLFELSERLFNIRIVERTEGIDTWHKDVRFFEIFEYHSTAPVAGFYLDPYARDDEKMRIKENTGWMIGIRNRSSVTDLKPLAALVFNFQDPLYGKPSLLSFKDVQLLFHKFGHALQHLITRANYSEVSGMSNIEWDAVEVCGHVLSHWLYESSTLTAISSHYASEDPLPLRLHETILNIRSHMSGLDLCRQLYLSNLDLELHSSKLFWLDIVKNTWPQYFAFAFDKRDSHPCSFTQIFSEEWGAAYFCHVWSRVVAADAFSAFYEAKGDEQEVKQIGKRFRDTFLALGGGSHPSEVFRRFRGRDPSPKALLNILRLKKVQKNEPEE